jgi:ABC-type lipoprotein export system ATPase subunit
MNATATTDAVVELRAVCKDYGSGASLVRAVDHLSLTIPRGQFVSIMGPSGCGKSTLLGLIAGFDDPTAGQAIVLGEDVATLSETARCRHRARHIGFVVQSFDLLPRLTVEENVIMRLGPLGIHGRAAVGQAQAVLDEVGIAESLWARYPGELSGGQQQRVAVARALVAQPDLVLADEPTGNLDSTSGALVLDLLRTLNRERGMSVVMVTHDHFAASYGHRTIEMTDGRIVLDVGLPPPDRRPTPLPIRRGERCRG